ncbi:MAG: PilZ domain-containing protein [Phycisphaerales bacterium]
MAINSYLANTVQIIDRSIRSTVAAAKNAVEQRRFGRFKASRTIACNLGRVLDFSASGMRLLTRRELPDVVALEFGEPDNIVAVNARVVWRKQHGRREFESGLEFDGITPRMQQQIWALARTV